MKVVPIKLSNEIIKKIDYLVKIGKYPNRSAAIRKLIEERIKSEEFFYKNEKIQEEKINQIVNKLIQKKEVILDIAPDKTAAEIIAEGRER